MGLLLRQAVAAEPGAATTRWCVGPLPAGTLDDFTEGIGRPAWRLDLERNRAGRTGSFALEWDHGAFRLPLPPMSRRYLSLALLFLSSDRIWRMRSVGRGAPPDGVRDLRLSRRRCWQALPSVAPATAVAGLARRAPPGAGDGRRRPGGRLARGPAARAPPGGYRPEPAALVLVARIKSAMRIVARDEVAVRLGLEPGQALADARAMIPALDAVDDDPGADAALLATIADWAERYTPLVGLDADGLMLDVTGCAHLFGGEAALVADLLARLAAQGFAARAAIAGAPGAAHAAARFTACAVVPGGAAADLLAPLPLAALRPTIPSPPSSRSGPADRPGHGAPRRSPPVSAPRCCAASTGRSATRGGDRRAVRSLPHRQAPLPGRYRSPRTSPRRSCLTRRAGANPEARGRARA
jgi:hypothetical protein